jgi:hypothetical protein
MRLVATLVFPGDVRRGRRLEKEEEEEEEDAVLPPAITLL